MVSVGRYTNRGLLVGPAEHERRRMDMTSPEMECVGPLLEGDEETAIGILRAGMSLEDLATLSGMLDLTCRLFSEGVAENAVALRPTKTQAAAALGAMLEGSVEGWAEVVRLAPDDGQRRGLGEFFERMSVAVESAAVFVARDAEGA